MEAKPGLIFDVQRFSLHDGPGIRTTVFLKGCPLNCWWCHNPENWKHVPNEVYLTDRCIGCGLCVDAKLIIHPSVRSRDSAYGMLVPSVVILNEEFETSKMKSTVLTRWSTCADMTHVFPCGVGKRATTWRTMV